MVGSSLAIAAVAVSAGSSVMQAKAGKRAAKQQGRANEAQRKINQLKNLQAKRQFLRNFRQAQAAAIVGGIGAGVGLESSRVQGQLSGQRAQAGTAVTEFNRMDELGANMTAFLNSAARNQQRASTWGMVSQFAQQFITFSPGQDSLTEIDLDSLPKKRGP